MKHIDRLYARPTTKGNMGGWQERHMAAAFCGTMKRDLEQAAASLISSWLAYADAHKARYESGIGDDGVLGKEWEKIGQALLGLLNGELGRLDGGTLDGVIRGALTDEGFDPNI